MSHTTKSSTDSCSMQNPSAQCVTTTVEFLNYRGDSLSNIQKYFRGIILPLKEYFGIFGTNDDTKVIKRFMDAICRLQIKVNNVIDLSKKTPANDSSTGSVKGDIDELIEKIRKIKPHIFDMEEKFLKCLKQLRAKLGRQYEDISYNITRFDKDLSYADLPTGVANRVAEVKNNAKKTDSRSKSLSRVAGPLETLLEDPVNADVENVVSGVVKDCEHNFLGTDMYNGSSFVGDVTHHISTLTIKALTKYLVRESKVAIERKKEAEKIVSQETWCANEMLKDLRNAKMQEAIDERNIIKSQLKKVIELIDKMEKLMNRN